MAFTTLEQRFNASAREIYGRFSNTTGLVAEIKPDSAASKSRIKSDTRFTPVVSTIRDTNRVSKFLKSDKGVLFLSKQTLLQTGNTFAETRLYNPLETLLNVPPSLFVRRNIGFQNIIGKNRGALQQETIDSFKNTGGNILGSLINTALSPIKALTTSPKLIDGGAPFQNIINITGNNSSGKFFTRPEDSELDTRLSAKQQLSDMGNKRQPKTYENFGPYTDLVGSYQRFESQQDPIRPRAFKSLENTQGYFRYGDLYNIPEPEKIIKKEDLFINQIAYSTIIDNNTNSIDETNNVNSDIIKFIFSNADGTDPVHFRALISSIKENVKPEYNEQRYVGRIERFVTYSGVKRSVSLQFNIAAMTQFELDSMWLRINNLSGRAFPKGISQNGFMVPPLFRITIGNIYNDQPCYIDSLDFDFLDESITFDVDAEVSQVINVSMTLVLLEKRTKVYDSPFYAITEAMQGTKERTPPPAPKVNAPVVPPAPPAGERAAAQKTSRQEKPKPAPPPLPRVVLPQFDYRGEFTPQPVGGNRQLVENEQIAAARRRFAAGKNRNLGFLGTNPFSIGR